MTPNSDLTELWYCVHEGIEEKVVFKYKYSQIVGYGKIETWTCTKCGKILHKLKFATEIEEIEAK